MDYLIYILVGWGLTGILVNGSIFSSLRNFFLVKVHFLGKLFTCVQCSGFWVGILMGILSFFEIISSPFWDCSQWLVQVLASGFLISGSSVIINAIVFFLLTSNRKNNINNSDEED
jgi:hypothetical protein